MIVDYLEIGTSDWDTLCQSMQHRPGVRGISVEPVSYYLDRLPTYEGSTKVNVAINDTPGTLPVYYIRPHLFADHPLPGWLRGCSSVGECHPEAMAALQQLGIDDGIEEQSVEVITVGELCERYGVTGLSDCLKIDAEGMDRAILRSWLEVADVNPAMRPNLVIAEVNKFDAKADPEWLAIVERMKRYRYNVRYQGIDAVFRRG